MINLIKIETFNIEVCTLEVALALTRWNKTELAKALGVNRGTVNKHIKHNPDMLVRVLRGDDSEIVNIELINSQRGLSENGEGQNGKG